MSSNNTDERLHRYVTAMRNEKPDCVPIRPFLAEFCGKLAGYDSMQQSHDFQASFQAVCDTARVLDCDALVSNMVYVWTGLTQAHRLEVLQHPRHRRRARPRLPIHRTARRPGVDAARGIRSFDRRPRPDTY